LRKDRVINGDENFSNIREIEISCCPILDGLKIDLKFISVRLIESLLFSLDLLFFSLSGFSLAVEFLFFGLLFFP
jgi:hypothetical protein